VQLVPTRIAAEEISRGTVEFLDLPTPLAIQRSVFQRRWPLKLCLALCALLLACGAAWAVFEWRFERERARAIREAELGQFEKARQWLAVLPSARLRDPETAYWLGVCEHAAGHYEAALAAWSRVPAGSIRSTEAALARAQTLVGNLGRFADAEPILEAALRAPGPSRVEVRHTLGQLYFWEARRDAMRRLIVAGWADAPRPADELRDLWLIDDATTLVEEVRTAVETAARQAPDDDRVWLAQAGLATQAGRFDEAARRLEACVRRRPRDPAVWRARLDRARASGDADEVRETLAHLPGEALTEGELLELGAWLEVRRGDISGERLALQRLVEVEPGRTRALERLAALASESGHSTRARTLRRRKATLDEAKDRYRRLLLDRVPAGHLAELAGLAETLGRPFEAKGWWLLASRAESEDPEVERALERLRNGVEPARTAGLRFTTLAERLASLLPQSANVSASRAPTSPAPAAAGATPRFRDDAEAASLRFVFNNGRSPQRQLPETTSGGVAMLDYDGDGKLDVYVVQGGVFPPDRLSPKPGDRLFRNRGDGTFDDVTERSGIAAIARGYSHGVAVGDYDNDGLPDLFITRWRSYALYRNRGDGRFEDMTARAGLAGDRDWPTSAAFADLDNDGDLDLYVCHYLVWDAEHPKLCPRSVSGSGPEPTGTDPERLHGYCMPHPFPALPDHLFRNDNGRFVDVTAEAGIIDREGRGLGVVAADVDDDGKVDLFVANDTTANYLFHNLGGMKFEEVGLTAGVACNAEGAFQAGMGTACADLDGDGRLDLLVTNFYGESTTFFRNLGGGAFSDETAAIGLVAPSRFLLGFGIVATDVNNDGRLDLATANGHVNDERPKYPYAMPAQLLIGTPSGRLADVTEAAGPPWRVPRVGRGLAVGDLDNDGRSDALLLAQDSPLAYFHNQSAAGHWITIRLEGTVSNRDAVGASVVVSAGGRRQVAQRTGGGSFQSASDSRLHFGLAGATRVDSIEVRWPSGRVDRHRDLSADTGYLLREGSKTPMPLAGFPETSGTRQTAK
jgi:tetratricopeptide (TPR) repeat protein